MGQSSDGGKCLEALLALETTMRSHVMLISLCIVLEPKLARWAFAGMNAQVMVVPLLLIFETFITPVTSHMHIQRTVMLLQLRVVLESKLAF